MSLCLCRQVFHLDFMNNLFFKFKKNKQGTALLMTILILNSILIISLSASRLVVSGIKMSGTQIRSTKAFFAAEAGAERSLYEWRKNSYIFPPSDQTNIFSATMGNNSDYTVNFSSSTPASLFFFTSTGSFSALKRSVEIELDFS